MRCFLTRLILICCLAFMSQWSVTLAGSAISVPGEAREAAQELIAAEQELKDKEQQELYRFEAEMYAEKAKNEKTEAILRAKEAERLLSRSKVEAEQKKIEAASASEKAKEAIGRAAALNEEAKRAMSAAETALESANTIEAALKAEESVLMRARAKRVTDAVRVITEEKPYNPLEDTDELLRMEKEIRMMEKMQKAAELTLRRNVPMILAQDEISIDWSKAEAAYAYADELNHISIAADKEAEMAERIADEEAAHAEQAASEAEDARLAMLDADLVLNDANAYVVQAKKHAIEAQAELEQLIYSQEHPQGVHSFSQGVNYYSWHNNGNSGYQISQPLYFGYWEKDFSFGLYSKHIISKNKTTGASGRVNSFYDTALDLSKRNDNQKFSVDYGVYINIPTGKANLSASERYSMMNEDLVDVSQFGKGWEFTPRVNVSWKIGKNDMWSIGTSYAFSGSYDPTSDIVGDNVSPGSVWKGFLRWQHVRENWQFAGEMINTANGLTKIADGYSYKEGRQWEYRLTYNRKLPRNQYLLLYYWRDNQNVSNIVPYGTSNAIVHYIGTMWSKKTDDKRLFRISFDVMKTDGSRYAGIYNYNDNGQPQYAAIEVDGRTKYTAGVGYDLRLSENSNLSIDMQFYKMKDGKSTLEPSSATYKGSNFFIKLNKSF
ncbi:hypothetical protein SDC9_74779 [bioreactor metagenome]|uniref:Uncharacterized protein n=1 Tax=bioreactor metagenome TaxID=1076179 RepID=A0A644YIV2_9ZZZZ